MGLKWKPAVLTAIAIAAVSGAAGHAQTGADSQAQPNSTRRAPANVSDSQFDIGVSVYGTMNDSSTGNGTQQDTTNSAGGMLEGRYIHSSLVGFEMTYGFNPANQTISPASNCSTYYTCNYAKTPLTVRASEVAMDWVFSKKFGDIRPFAVAGLGFFITSPGRSTYEVNTVVRGTYIAGGGVDVGVTQHLGVRAQVRDNIYKAPNLSAFYPATGVYTHTLEPAVGVFYRF